jgi:hypothetical protein
LLGVIFHWLGGLASASFYVPYRGVKRWSWEIFWLTGGLFSWLLAPWLFASVQTQDLMGVMAQVPSKIVGLCVLFGVLWGFGGLTYGLTMRYLGLSLGMAVVLGLCTVFGTLIPPIVQGDFADKLLATASGRIILLGLAVTLAGIVVVALAGARKDAALSEDAKKAVIAEFDFKKGIGLLRLRPGGRRADQGPLGRRRHRPAVDRLAGPLPGDVRRAADQRRLVRLSYRPQPQRRRMAGPGERAGRRAGRPVERTDPGRVAGTGPPV